MIKNKLIKYKENTNEEKYEAAHNVKNKIKDSMKLVLTKRNKSKDKKNYATFQKIFDNKTKKNIEKLIKNEKMDQLGDMISSGKEANVYFSKNLEKNIDVAVKIYKVMVTTFKDRDDYIDGEYRFKMNPGTRNNPYKMINLWALKEYRNLSRIYNKKILCPKPLFIKNNILIMELLGTPDNIAKRLRDVKLSLDKLNKIYLQIIKLIRKLFMECKLVHADLSEYNLLYHNEQIYVIDVSQSVENNHPKCLEFLKRDIFNINSYFKKLNVNILKLKDLFDFITDSTIKKEKVKENLIQLLNENMKDEDKNELEYIGKDFLDKYIPRSLHELNLYQVEKEVIEDNKLNSDNYKVITGIKDNNLSEIKETEEIENNNKDENYDELISNNSISEEKEKEKKIVGDAKYAGLDKKERKKLVKEQNREKRKNKVPKHIKKKLDKKRSNYKK